MQNNNTVNTQQLIAAGLPRDFDPNGDCSIEQAKTYHRLLTGVSLLNSNPNTPRNDRSNGQISSQHSNQKKSGFHAGSNQSRERRNGQSRGRHNTPNHQEDKAPRSSEDSGTKSRFNKQPSYFNVCRQLVNTGICPKCKLSPRQAIETLACFLAQEGINPPTSANDPMFMPLTVAMLSRSQGYEEIAYNFQSSLRVPPVPSDTIIPDLLRCDLVTTYHRLIDHPDQSFVSPSTIMSDKDKMMARKDASALAETPPNTVRDHYGIYGGCSTELNLLPAPQMILSTIAEDIVEINQDNWRYYATMQPPCHPNIARVISDNFDTLQANDSQSSNDCRSLKDVIQSFVPQLFRPFFSTWVNCPRIVNCDVTDCSPGDYLTQSNRSAFAEEEPALFSPVQHFRDKAHEIVQTAIVDTVADSLLLRSVTPGLLQTTCMVAYNAVKCIIKGSVTKPAVRSFVSAGLTCTSRIVNNPIISKTLSAAALLVSSLPAEPDFVPINRVIRDPIEIIPFNPVSPDDRRLCLPIKARLEPHPANINVGCVLNAINYQAGVPVASVFYCPEITYNLSPNDINRPESTWTAAWSSLDNKNTNIAYPPSWRPLILMSSNIYRILSTLGDFSSTRYPVSRPPIGTGVCNFFFRMLLPMFLSCLVRCVFSELSNIGRPRAIRRHRRESEIGTDIKP